jgi:hypothetical protein
MTSELKNKNGGYPCPNLNTEQVYEIKEYVTRVSDHLIFDPAKIDLFFKKNMPVLTMEAPVTVSLREISKVFFSESRENVAMFLDHALVIIMGFEKIGHMTYIYDGMAFKMTFNDDDDTDDDTDDDDDSSDDADADADDDDDDADSDAGADDADDDDADDTTVFKLRTEDPHVIGGLDILEKIGSGAYSNVFTVKDSPTGCVFVLKLFTDPDPEMAKKECSHELNALKRIAGIENVVQPYVQVNCSFFGRHLIGYTMPLYSCGTLKSKTFSKFSVETKLRLMKELVVAIYKCNQKGVFHCDIKAINILFDVDPDGTPHPILADFGISILVERSQNPSWFIKTGGDRENYSPWSRDPLNWLQKGRMFPEYSMSSPAEMWALCVTFVDVLSDGRFKQDPIFNVFRNGDYFQATSQCLVDAAINSIFSEPEMVEYSKFFKKWLNINRFRNLLRTVPLESPKFVPDYFGELIHDLDEILQPTHSLVKESHQGHDSK